ncbi:MAG: hypothetical protein ISR76_06355 [Planctomycetes bacterium]|nr:hypothetical protein [Planctomycetota bacterium]MBL7008602.1 hypothetical protein [Planctomycetota bacterium]
MNAVSPEKTRTAPGSHNPDFSPENPAVTWVKENKGYLLFLLLMIAGIASWQQFWPRYQQGGLTNSWGLFQELTSDPANFSVAKVEETLSRSRTDSRIHPWVVHTGVSSALSSNDLEALRILRSELQALTKDGTLAGYRLVGDDGPESVFAYSLAMAERALNPEAERVFTNPAPTGHTIRFSVKVNDQDTYDFEAGLYEDSSPEACALLLEAVRSGRLVDLEGVRQGSFGLRFKGLVENGVEHELPLERQWGYFHLPGALYLNMVAGKPGQMDPSALELGIEKAHHLDAQSSVIGMLTSGLEHLDQFKLADADTPDPIASMVLTSIQVIEE